MSSGEALAAYRDRLRDDQFLGRALAQDGLAGGVWSLSKFLRLVPLSTELGLFGGAFQRQSGGCAASDHLGDSVKVPSAYKALVLDRFVAVVLLPAEFLFLQTGVGGHSALTVAAGQFEHAQVQGVETGQGH